jgi:hypothetical protein
MPLNYPLGGKPTSSSSSMSLNSILEELSMPLNSPLEKTYLSLSIPSSFEKALSLLNYINAIIKILTNKIFVHIIVTNTL